MSNKSRGKTAERECRKLFEKKGYVCDFKEVSRFGSEDLFGIFDFIAIKPGSIKLIQVKSSKKRISSNVSTAKSKIMKWTTDLSQQKMPLGFDCEIHLKVNYKGWRIWELTNNGDSIEWIETQKLPEKKGLS